MQKSQIVLKQGDITKEQVDIIVNAANSSLLGGGGVDGAIHRAGGPSILEECRKIREERGRCLTGQAVITTAGNLDAKYVIHTVGPIWNGGNKNETELLKQTYLSCLNLADQYKATTIAFPAISTGTYRFPLEEAARIACNTIKNHHSKTLEEIRLILFTVKDLETYNKILETL